MRKLRRGVEETYSELYQRAVFKGPTILEPRKPVTITPEARLFGKGVAIGAEAAAFAVPGVREALVFGGPAEVITRGPKEFFRYTKEEPLEVFEKAIKNATPLLEVKSKRVGGATYQVPRQVREERGLTLAMRWIINSAKSKKGKPMKEKLAEELILAAKNEGSAVKKKEDTHRMAEANRAFAHFAW